MSFNATHRSFAAAPAPTTIGSSRNAASAYSHANHRREESPGAVAYNNGNRINAHHHGNALVPTSSTSGHAISGSSVNGNVSANRSWGSAEAYEELARRIAALNTRLATIEEREVAAVNTTAASLAAVRGGVDQMGAIIARLETKISKDAAFLEETLERRLADEEERRAEVENGVRKAIADELGAFRSTAAAAAAAGGSPSSPLPHATTSLSPSSPNSAGASNSHFHHSHGHLPQTHQQARELQELRRRVDAMGDAIDAKAHALQQRIAEAAEEVQQNVAGVLEALEASRRGREAGERGLQSLVEESIAALSQELAEERRQRTESHKHLERVLLEAASRQWARA